MKKIISVLLISALLFCGCSINNKPYSKSEFLLNTYCEITLYGSDKCYLDSAFSELSRLDNYFKLGESGILYKFNGGLTLNETDELYKVASISEKYRSLSGGKYNPYISDLTDIYRSNTVPDKETAKSIVADAAGTRFENGTLTGNGKLDVGSVAKGHIGEQIKNHLVGLGVKSGIINLGGNVTLIGDKFGDSFTVSLKKPFSDGSIAFLKLKDTTVSTCGIYERFFEENGINYHHIIDATTGYPLNNGLNSVTVIWNNAEEADALSTFLFTEGLSDGMKYVESQNGIEAIFITDSNEIILSSGLIQDGNTIMPR